MTNYKSRDSAELSHFYKGGVKMINELEIKNLCKQYNYRYKIYDNTNKIKVYTGLDEWLIDCTNHGYVLKHFSKGSNNKGKCHYHKQRAKPFKDLNFLFRSLHTHKPISQSHNRVFRIKELLKEHCN